MLTACGSGADSGTNTGTVSDATPNPVTHNESTSNTGEPIPVLAAALPQTDSAPATTDSNALPGLAEPTALTPEQTTAVEPQNVATAPASQIPDSALATQSESDTTSSGLVNSTEATPASAAPDTDNGRTETSMDERAPSEMTAENATSNSDSSVADTNALIAVALRDGDASGLNAQQLLEHSAQQLQRDFDQCSAVIGHVYQGAVDALTMPYLSNYVYSNRRSNYPLIVDRENGATYGWIGQPNQGPRHAYFGASIFQLNGGDYYGNLGNEARDTLFSVIAWLVQHEDTNLPVKDAPLTLVVSSPYVAARLGSWISHHIASPAWTVTDRVDQLQAEHTHPVLYVGTTNDGKAPLEQALDANIPALIWSEAFDPGDTVQAMGLSWHWWGPTITGGFLSAQEQCQAAYPLMSVRALTDNLANNTLEFDYPSAACTTPIYTTQCDTGQILHTSGNTLQQAVFDGLEEIQFQLKRLDFEGISVFDRSEDYEYLKLAVLIGDALRRNTTYPLDRLDSSPASFFGALYADYSQHYSRDSQPAQIDLGDYIQASTVSDDSTLQTHTITLPTTDTLEWTSTGLTAPAGHSITIERLDTTPVSVGARFNMLRSQSTWVWNTFGYTRPKFTRSHTVQIPQNQFQNQAQVQGQAQAQAQILSSPVGGPLYIQTGAELPDSQVTLRITGAVKHPTLTPDDETGLTQFIQSLAQRMHSWIDIVTPFVEVHSRLDLIEEAFDRQDGVSDNGYTNADIRHWSDDLDLWLIKTNLSLAGIQSDDLPAIKSGVIERCQALQLDCQNRQLHRRLPKQHINADIRASCGDLCSGNPFDSNSFVNPAGFGESHEMGHNLQRYRFNIYGNRSSESSNNIFPYHVAYSIAQSGDQTTQSTTVWPDTMETYEQLQASLAFASQAGEGHPIWAEAGIYDNVVTRTQFYLQLAFIHDRWLFDSNASLTEPTDGWDIYTLLYLLEREFNNAVNGTDAQWIAQRDRLGFSLFDRGQANTIKGADFLAIALSHISEQDHTDYFDTWGIALSNEALMQINSAGYTQSVPRVFWRTPESGIITSDMPSRDPDNSRPLDGFSDWY